MGPAGRAGMVPRRGRDDRALQRRAGRAGVGGVGAHAVLVVGHGVGGLVGVALAARRRRGGHGDRLRDLVRVPGAARDVGSTEPGDPGVERLAVAPGGVPPGAQRRRGAVDRPRCAAPGAVRDRGRGAERAVGARATPAGDRAHGRGRVAAACRDRGDARPRDGPPARRRRPLGHGGERLARQRQALRRLADRARRPRVRRVRARLAVRRPDPGLVADRRDAARRRRLDRVEGVGGREAPRAQGTPTTSPMWSPCASPANPKRSASC